MSKDELAQLRDENKKLRAQVEILTNALRSSNMTLEQISKNLKSHHQRVYREEEK